MKKVLRGIATIWCVLCGLVVPPAALAVVIARSMGVLDLGPVVDRIQGGASAGASSVGGAGLAHSVAGIPPGELATPLEAFAWRRRLEQLGAEVGAGSQDLAARESALAAREAAQTELANSLSGLLGDLLGTTVPAESVAAEPAVWRDRLAAQRGAESLRPRLIDMVKNVENEALASILANPTASNGLDEDTVTRLMEDLPPSRAGEVLTELASRDPAFASRILARLERSAGPPDGEGVPRR
jgi:hypothetical protein